ncbi:MAG: hypothetical protein QG620_466 [Patescibacteria group bacterium]|nr:hypothetical protein [Patescibacteria group bacterium]
MSTQKIIINNVEITITVKNKSEEGWVCDGCGQRTTVEPIDEEGGQYCFCSLRCLWKWERSHSQY